MRFLRMLTNSLMAGALGAAYLTVIVLQLNPQVPLFSATTWRWFLTLGLLYGVHLAVVFYVLMMVREFFSLEVLSPGWASVRVLGWLAGAAAGIAAALMWLNLRAFGPSLSEADIERMTVGAGFTTAGAAILVVLAASHSWLGPRGRRVTAVLFAIAAPASLALPLAARGAGAAPAFEASGAVLEDTPMAASTRREGPRVLMLLLDGGSLEYVLPRVVEGRLPNFARLLEKGARMDLATLRPTQPNPVWAAVATGMNPSKNGIRSAAAHFARFDTRPVDLLPDYCFSNVLVRLGFVDDVPHSSQAWRARPIWSILARAGLTVGVVRWPLTYPAPDVPGFVVSDRLHQLTGSILDFDRAGSPQEILPLLQAAATDLQAEGTDLAARAARSASDAPDLSALARDRLYSRAARELTARLSPRFLAVRYEGLDTVGHYYLKYTDPRAVRDVPEEQRRRLLQAFDHYYEFIDGEIGASLATMEAGDLLVVVSGFGMQPVNPVKQTIGRLLRDPDFSGTHERAPDGFLLAYGTAAEPGRQPRGSIVDVTPTLLYFLGLPVARDMDGFARADLFTKSFTSERPIAFIPTYR